MQDRTPRPDDLEPIERASVDELRDLQLSRLRWSLRHAHEHVPHYRKAFDERQVHPDDLHDLADLARFPFTDNAVLAKTTRSACPASGSAGCTPRPAPPGGRPWSATPRTTCGPGPR